MVGHNIGVLTLQPDGAGKSKLNLRGDATVASEHAPLTRIVLSLDYESRGQEFESLRARHNSLILIKNFCAKFSNLTAISLGQHGATPEAFGLLLS
jgi:hypothetical protein